jgi:hypothetical protein
MMPVGRDGFLYALCAMQKQGHASWRAGIKPAPWRLVAPQNNYRQQN